MVIGVSAMVILGMGITIEDRLVQAQFMVRAIYFKIIFNTFLIVRSLFILFKDAFKKWYRERNTKPAKWPEKYVDGSSTKKRPRLSKSHTKEMETDLTSRNLVKEESKLDSQRTAVGVSSIKMPGFGSRLTNLEKIPELDSVQSDKAISIELSDDEKSSKRKSTPGSSHSGTIDTHK